MTTKRYDASIVQLNSTTLWIVGGYNGDYSETKSSEFIGLDSTVGKPGPKFPYPVTGACAVKYSEDKVYVMGGYDGLTSYHPSNKVLIFDPKNWFIHNEAGVPLCKKWNRMYIVFRQLLIHLDSSSVRPKQYWYWFSADIFSICRSIDSGDSENMLLVSVSGIGR